MTLDEVAKELGCSVTQARTAYRRLVAALKMVENDFLANEHRRSMEREKRKARILRRRLPQWCRPFWERRDGVQHIVFCSAKRRRDKEPTTAFWLWFNGQPVAKSDTIDGAKSLAALRAMMYDTYVWDASQWEEEMRRNPQIAEVRKACGV